MTKNANLILIAGFCLILILLVLLAAIGIKNMAEMNRRMEDIIEIDLTKGGHIHAMQNHARERSVSLQKIVLLEDPFEIDEEVSNFSRHASLWLQAKEKLLAYDLDEALTLRLEELFVAGGIIAGQQSKVIEFINNQQRHEAMQLLLQEVIPGQDQVMRHYVELLKHQHDLLHQEVAQSRSEYHSAIVSIILLTIAVIIVGVGIGIFVIMQNNRIGIRLLKDRKKIEYFTYQDTLTGLPNRHLLMDRLRQEVIHSKSLNNYGAVLFVDIDNFKTLNDSLGHKLGDQLIQQIAQRITSSIRADDTASRLGGDEFVVIVPALDSQIQSAIQKAEKVAEQIRTQLSAGYQLGESHYHLTASIGIAIIENGRTPPGELLKQANSALHSAKGSGKNLVRFYESSMQELADKRLATEQDIRSALFAGQYLLYYQPQISSQGKLIGIEALVRWNHPEKGFISPLEFIPVAEESGLIIPMGIEILDIACRFLTAIEQNPLPESFVSLSVNISPKQFAQADFVDIIAEKIVEYGFNPAHLMLEITEGLLLNNVDEVVDKMNALKSLSIKFSIDDFGTGYSSMQYLQRLPLDELKIDQSFVRDVDNNPQSSAIAQTIISMASNLELSIVAEGVEHETQRDFLQKNGCHCFQGYLYDRPLPPETILEKYFNHRRSK